MKTNDKKVIIGLTGRLDSSVAAYILKKQGYECVGVTLMFTDPELPEKANQALKKALDRQTERDYSYQAQTESLNFTRKPLVGRCHVADVKKIKGFCDWLDIPFYAVRAQDYFSDEILNEAVSAKLMGRYINPCLSCQRLKIDILLEKASILGAASIATGHYAKINYNQANQKYALLSSNDLKNDQSSQLMGLGQKELEKLLLPLSEMRREEVKKIAKTIQYPLDDSQSDHVACYVEDSRFPFYVEAMASESLFKSGSVTEVDSERVVGDHYGIHYFRPHQNKLKLSSQANIDGHLQICKIDPGSGEIFVCDKKKLETRFIFISNLQLEYKKDISRPIECYIKLHAQSHEELVAAKVIYKNNHHALVELEQAYQGQLFKGEVICFYQRRGVGARVLGSGVVEESGHFRNSMLYAYPTLDEFDGSDDEQEDEKDQKNELIEKFRF